MIVIYGRDDCAFCDMAIKLATEMDIPHRVNKMGTDVSMYEFKDMFPVARTVPQIHKVGPSGNEYIGGYTEFKAWVSSIEMLGEMSL